MFEIIVLCAFAAGLLSCILLGYSILYALLFGYALFFSYGLVRRYRFGRILTMSLNGIRTVKNILWIFLLIGMITAVWRACGTIPFIIYYSSKLIVPSIFLLVVFLLCCLISTLTGTAFGTAATVGVICMTIANAMEINQILAGGAILSGIYFGDRCSPMSTSALLVAELTGTNIYRNIRNMVRTAIGPFVIACALYLLLGSKAGVSNNSSGIWDLFARNFNLHWTVVIPAALILILVAMRVNVKIAMAVSIAAGCVIALAVQHLDLRGLAISMITGFHASDGQLAGMMDGGGIASMLKVAAIVCLSSCYAGIFEGTGLLDRIKDRILWLSQKTTPYGSILVTSIATSMAACNQTLSIMLTHQLCKGTLSDNEELAIDLENTVVVIAPLVPWSIACATPLASVGAPSGSIVAAFYLYLLSIWNFFLNSSRGKKPRS